MWTGLHCLGIYTVDRMALILNEPFGQVVFELEMTLYTGWHWLGIYTVERLALTWNLPCGQECIVLVYRVGFDLEFTLWTSWH